MSSAIRTIGVEPDPEQRLRNEWAESLRSHMAIKGVSRKQLVHGLAGCGVDVTQQAVGTWLRAEVSPRPHVQAAIAHVLKAPARSLFPLTYEAA